jgi:hypothetical protein
MEIDPEIENTQSVFSRNGGTDISCFQSVQNMATTQRNIEKIMRNYLGRCVYMKMALTF